VQEARAELAKPGGGPVRTARGLQGVVPISTPVPPEEAPR
jgi:hypothetical protein